METFDLIRDDLVSIWRRTRCTVKANSLEEAVELVKNEDYDDCESEFLYETEELIDPKNNDGCATTEIFKTNIDNILYSNE